ncbi:hypothetical protein LTR08_000406 [Meristemomyces frigidus]|nr:hypothetical protein LTR08_000406 [Meristemomyces frigidus]
MTDKLPHNLLALFQPRPPLRYLPHTDHAPEDRRTCHITGVAAYLSALRDDTPVPYHPSESWLEARDRRLREEQAKQDWEHGAGFADLYKPTEDPSIRGDAFKTLFVARLPYDADIKDLEREFGRFGPIERIRVVADTGAAQIKKEEAEAAEVKREEEEQLTLLANGVARRKKKQKKAQGPKKAPVNGKSRGYAFVVFEREKDMKAAYKETDHLLIRTRRVLVDVERGRTVSGWRPRRFGGGLGGRHYTKGPPPKPTGFGPPAGPGGFSRGGGGGFRGGFGDRGGGGFRGRGDFGGRGGGRGGFGGERGGGYGDRNGGFGDRGGYGGGRGGIGYGAPDGAPAGPRGGGGFGGSGGGYGGSRGGGGGGAYEDRGARGAPNANYEPLPPRANDAGRGSDAGRGGDARGGGGGDARGGGGGYRDRDAGSSYSGQGQKRPYDGGGYDESRSRRRY